MAAFILLAAVGFGLGDALAELGAVIKSADEDLPDEVRCDFENVTPEKFRPEPHTRRLCSSSASGLTNAVL